jgi:hypothetical protein
MPVELSGLDQAHDGRGALSGEQPPSKEPVLAPRGQFRFILPMSGKKSRSSIVGMPYTASDCGACTASDEPLVRWST